MKVQYQGLQGEDACPPAPTILNIRQFMTEEEVAEGMGEPHWFVAYSHTLQWVGKAACGQKWEWPMREALEDKVPTGVHLLGGNWCGSHSGLHQTVLEAHP